MIGKTSMVWAVPIAVALCANPAGAAAVPQLSGDYALQYIETCQATISTSKNQGTPDLSTVNTVDVGRLSGTIATATFAGKPLTMTLSGWQDQGDLFILQNLGGNQMSEVTSSLVFTVTHTASSITLTQQGEAGAKPQTFHAIYGDIVAGVAHRVDFLGLSKGGCYAFGSAVQWAPCLRSAAPSAWSA
jgi:hypothetical protein